MNENTRLKEEVRMLRRQVEEIRRENTVLRQKLDALAQRFFGKKSEQLSAAQLEFLLTGLDQEPGPDPKSDPEEEPEPVKQVRRRRTGRHAVRTPENLEVVREVIEPEIVSEDPDQWKRIGEEVSRRLDYCPGKFFWQETVRPKYVHTGDRSQAPVVARAPEQAILRGLAAPGLLAQILVSRFSAHLPYYRQAEIFWQRHQVGITRQQMVRWVEQCAMLLSGIAEQVRLELIQSPYLQIDETPVKYQDRAVVGRCAQGYLWTVLRPGQGVYFHWELGRSAQCLERLLGEDFEGTFQCDGYSAYQAYTRRNPAVQRIGCWAHARRAFFEAREQAPAIAGWLLNQIGLLYRVERELRQSRAGPGLRAATRSARSKMVLERIREALVVLKPRYLPRSPMGRAIAYTLDQWKPLENFIGTGEAEVDNNLVENAIRPTAIGKKNWLFMGSGEAGERNAAIYTLIANCRMHGVEPYAYLKELLERLPTATNQQFAEFTPKAWSRRQPSPIQAAA